MHHDFQNGLSVSVREQWKALRSPALAGRRFETWDEVAEAVAQATDYWNAHRHPFTWGQRRRHRPGRQPGIALCRRPHDLPDEPLRAKLLFLLRRQIQHPRHAARVPCDV